MAEGDVKLRKQRSPDDMLSDNAGQPFSPPTFLYDAACCACDPNHGRENAGGFPGYPGPYNEQGYQHRMRLQEQTIKQGSSTLGRVEGDFDYIGGVPSELMNKP